MSPSDVVDQDMPDPRIDDGQSDHCGLIGHAMHGHAPQPGSSREGGSFFQVEDEGCSWPRSAE